MKIDIFRNLYKKQRKYPIKYDASGKSARRRAFELFAQGIRPVRVASEIGIPKSTAFRYHHDWKKLPRDFDTKCRLARKLLKGPSGLDESTLKAIADHLKMPVERLRVCLEEPWAFRRLVLGKLVPETHRESRKKEYHRLEVALDLVGFWEELGIPPERQREVIGRLIRDMESEQSRTKEVEEE